MVDFRWNWLKMNITYFHRLTALVWIYWYLVNCQDSDVLKWLVEFHVLKEQSSCHDLNKLVSLSDHCLLHITFVPCLLMQSVHSAGHEPFPSLMAEIDVVSGLRNHYFPPVKWQWEVSRADRVFLLTEIKWRTFPQGRMGRFWQWDHAWLVDWGPWTLSRATDFTLQIKTF